MKKILLEKIGFIYLEHCHPDHPEAVEEFPELLFLPPQLSFCRFSCFQAFHQMHPIKSSSHVCMYYESTKFYHDILIAFFKRFS